MIVGSCTSLPATSEQTCNSTLASLGGELSGLTLASFSFAAIRAIEFCSSCGDARPAVPCGSLCCSRWVAHLHAMLLPGIDGYCISSAGCRLKPELQDAVHSRSIESLRSGGRFDGRARGNSASTDQKDDHRSPVLRASEIRALAYRVKSPCYVCQRNTSRPGHVLSCTSVRLNS